jgi:hypothetical protein
MVLYNNHADMCVNGIKANIVAISFEPPQSQLLVVLSKQLTENQF